FLLARRLPSPPSSWSANGLRRRIGAATAAAIRITLTRRRMRRLSGTTAFMLGTMALSVATPGATMEVRIPQRGTFNASQRCGGLRNPDQRRHRAGAAMVRADATSDLQHLHPYHARGRALYWPSRYFCSRAKKRGGRTNPMARQ